MAFDDYHELLNAVKAFWRTDVVLFYLLLYCYFAVCCLGPGPGIVVNLIDLT